MEKTKLDFNDVKTFEYLTGVHMLLGRGSPVISDEELFEFFNFASKKLFKQKLTLNDFERITSDMGKDENKFFSFTSKGMEFNDKKNYTNILGKELQDHLDKETYLELIDLSGDFAYKNPGYKEFYKKR